MITYQITAGSAGAQLREQFRANTPRNELGPTELANFEVAASEAAANASKHGRMGVCQIKSTKYGGLQFVIRDRGEMDFVAATKGPQMHGGGRGLGAMGRMLDELMIMSTIGGTIVRGRMFPKDPNRPRVVAILRSARGESRCGDGSLVQWLDRGLRVVVTDGTGHGQPAQASSALALSTFAELTHLPLTDAVAEADVASRGTRGAAMTAVEIQWRDHSAQAVCVGNVSLTCLGDKGWNAPASDGALGLRHQGRGPRIFATPFPACAVGGVMLAHSDGVAHRKVHRKGLVHKIRRDPVGTAVGLIAEDTDRHDDSTILMVLAPAN